MASEFSIAYIVLVEIIGCLAGIGICLLYAAYRLHLDEQEHRRIKENTALIVNWMREQHELKMEMMRSVNKTRKEQMK